MSLPHQVRGIRIQDQQLKQHINVGGAAMSEILAKPDELVRQSQNMKSRADATRTEFGQLRSKLEQIQDQFRGSAAQAFDGQYKSWDDSAKQIVEALEGLGDWLAKAAETVERTDRELAKGLG